MGTRGGTASGWLWSERSWIATRRDRTQVLFNALQYRRYRKGFALVYCTLAQVCIFLLFMHRLQRSVGSFSGMTRSRIAPALT